MLDVIVKEKGKQELFTKQKIKWDGWRDKLLHELYLSRTDDRDMSCWRWLQAGYLKKKTESLLIAALDTSDQGLRVTILKQQGSKKCKMCNERDEAVMHIFSEFSKLA